MKLVKFTRFTAAVVLIYLFLSAFAAYYLFKDYSQDVHHNHDDHNDKHRHPKGSVVNHNLKTTDSVKINAWDFSLNDFHNPDPPDTEEDVKHVVEVWGKAAVGNYLWEHILAGELTSKMGGLWSFGAVQVKDILFQFRTGPGVVPQKAPQTVENLVLVLNGREPAKVAGARVWLDYLPEYTQLRHVAVLLLGNERCDNDWLKPYLSSNGGRVQFVFVVYDSPDVDDYNFYQWPLGVATYRNFPKVDISSINTQKKRYFKCNFLGTVYHNSSRSELLQILEKEPLSEKCYIKPRMQWWPQETLESQADYIHALLQSDLTLSPVGKNSECYRVYEAMSYGSVPVIENKITPGRCSNSTLTPLRLLKHYRAPVISVRDWSELPALVESDSKLSLDSLVRRRQNVIEWYIYFKRKMKEKFVGVIRERFFNL